MRSASRYERFERATDPLMLALSIAFLPVFVLSLIPRLSPSHQLLLEIASWLIWATFLVEFSVKLALAPSRRAMLRRHGFDLVVILLPFLRVLRAGRALRVLHGLTRTVVAVGGTASLGHALASARRVARREGDRYVFLLVLLATIAGAVIILEVERPAPESNIRSFPDAIWWAVSTVTTVGYGDYFPTTPEGRVIALLLMVFGLGLFSVITARVAAFFIVDKDEVGELHTRLDRIEAALRAQSDTKPSGSSADDSPLEPSNDDAAPRQPEPPTTEELM